MTHSTRSLCCACVLAAALAMAPAFAGQTRLGTAGTRFTINDQPTFLLGVSYYGALGASRGFILQDLDECRRVGFNWLRVWAVWDAFENDVSAVNSDGSARQPYLGTLRWLVAECDRRGIVVDVTLTRGRLVPTFDAHMTAVRTIVKALSQHGNWYLDLANERNIGDARFVSFEELRALRDEVKRLAPQVLVTASQGGDLSRDELGEYVERVRVDFIAPHRPRSPTSPGETADMTRAYHRWMDELGRPVPVHYQEPFRRGYAPRHWEPTCKDFALDLKQARESGAAGWCLHNGSQKDATEERPRRSFDMREQPLFRQFDKEERCFLASLEAAQRQQRGGASISSRVVP